MIAAIVIGCVLAAAGIVVLWGVCENHAPMLSRVRVESERLPRAFDGFTIVHVSDLHNAAFGKGQKKLLRLIDGAHADIIVITGDLIDKRRAGMRHALQFAEEAVKRAPVYYVTGNHEAKSKEYPALQAQLDALGVVSLHDAAVPLARGGAQIAVAGLRDVRFFTQERSAFAADVRRRLQGFLPQDTFTLLLAHRPELFQVYCAAGADVTLCGHAHGGQFRIPLLGGMIAPEQGLFPKYTAGAYRAQGKTMVVSRGLGNSSVPIRLNNCPEVVAVTLACAAERGRNQS